MVSISQGKRTPRWTVDVVRWWILERRGRVRHLRGKFRRGRARRGLEMRAHLPRVVRRPVASHARIVSRVPTRRDAHVAHRAPRRVHATTRPETRSKSKRRSPRRRRRLVPTPPRPLAAPIAGIIHTCPIARRNRRSRVVHASSRPRARRPAREPQTLRPRARPHTRARDATAPFALALAPFARRTSHASDRGV